MTRQVIITGKKLELRLVLLARGDQAHQAHQPAGGPAGRQHDGAAVVNPPELAIFRPNPVFAIEGAVAGKMLRQLTHTRRHIFWIDASVKALSGRGEIRCRQAKKGLGLALPIQRIACQIPFIGKVAGRQQRRFQSTEVQKGVVVV